jgi:tungstate transport system ATP-binding protein
MKLHVKNGKPGPARISIDPERIKVGQGEGDLSPRNAFTGRLIQLTDENSRVRALMDVGIMLSVLIPKERLDGLDIRVGMKVGVCCPEESIEVF